MAIFSVIIPAHNEERDIGNCLERLLKQDCEIVVVDDHSIDETSKIVKEYMKKHRNVKLVRLKGRRGRSASAARNAGSEKAKGKYLVFIDADVSVPKNFIKKIKSDLPYDCLSYRFLSKEPKTIFQRAWSAYRKFRDKSGKDVHCIHVVKKELFEKVGGFDEKIFYNEDFDLKNRLLKLNPVYKVSDVVVYHSDPETFDDFVRQRRWQGRGVLTTLRRKKDYRVFRYFAPPVLLPLAFISPIPLILYILIFWIVFSVRTKDVVNSLLWVLLDYFGRFISLFYFCKELFKSK